MKDRGPLYAFWHPPRHEVLRRVLFVVLNISAWIIVTICLVLAVQLVNKPFPGFLVNERMTLGGYGHFSWSGSQAGLRFRDYILTANGRPVPTPEDLYDVIRQVPMGERVHYTVEREGVLRDEAIATMVFTWPDFLMTAATTLLLGLAYLTLGFIVYLLKPDTRMSNAFLLLCFCLGIYTILSFEILSTYQSLPLFIVIFCFLPATFLHLSLVFPTERGVIVRYPWLLGIPYIVSFLLLVPIELLYPDPEFIKYQAAVVVYIGISVLALIISTTLPFWERASVIARQRAKVLLIGTTVAFPIPAVGMFLSHSQGEIFDTPIQINLWGIPVLLFPTAIAYGITKHNLFEVDVFIKRAVGYVMMTVLVGLSYFSIQTVLRTFILDPMFGSASEQVYPIVFALLVVFAFNPANRAIQDLVDRLFFRKKFDYKDTVTSVSNALTSLLEEGSIIQKLTDTIRREMFVDVAGVFLLDAPSGGGALFYSRDGGDRGENDVKKSRFPEDDPIITLLSQERKLVTKFDIEEDPQYSGVREPYRLRFSELGVSLAIPLLYQNEMRGALILGYKKSGHFYSKEDIDLLETLANQGATALENARMAGQMKQDEGIRANLARYLSPQIVEQIMHKDVEVNLGGSRKVVTILFSDIRNFTAISETMPPDQLVQILNEYFTEMAKIIFANQGSLDKYIGDAIVAVFGSLIPLENAAIHAARAAAQMMTQMPVLNARWGREYSFNMEIGIGVNTGEVFLGNIGSPERMEFTVIGDAVNVASRFSGLAKPGQVLITRETLHALDGAISSNELPPSAVKGKTGKLEVFELTGT